ncbi:hypothetical protein VE02_04176 [Pseudogymnoascus sp. 03VT05]|nr:hypothetical protein VE02_04176 [Pseudogymnoascus sp. 03VT05]
MNGFQNTQGQQPPQQSPQQSLQQPPQQQQAQQQQAQPRPMLFKPEHMRALPDKFSIEEKKKWENGLAMLYRQIEANPPDTQAHRDAAKKIRDFSVTLHNKMQATANRPQAPNQQRPPSQAPSQQSQADGSVPPSQPQAPAQTAPARPPVSENMRNHVNSFPYVAPTTLGPAEAAQWIQEIKGKYLKALLTMENTAGGLKRLEAQVAVRTQGGKPLTPEEQKELQIKKDSFQKNHGDAKRFVDQFRRQQSDAAAQAQGGGSQAQQQPSHPPQGIAVPPRPTMNTQQPAQSQAMAQTEAVQAAMQAARNQQVNGGRPNVPTPNQPQNEQQNQSQPIGAANAANMPPAQNAQGGGAGGGAPIKSEGATAPGGLPHVNTALATAPHIQQMQNRPPAQNSPQSAVPPAPTSVGPPKPLTHSDAVAHAARTYSSSQAATGQPSVMASHSHPPSLPRDAPNIKTNLMPIPKVLPPRATESPHPMQMPPTRPTYSGGASGSGSGLMQQPVMQKAPGFNVEGDAERVLNKRKLDELIRQVTGGGEGLDNSEGLTPEVEDCVLSVADEFVDQVITAACKCAKARGSKTLEIRDIQLILERNYNIRIPGYASDEIRTVRKFLPAQGWIAKMSAVQASKVTGGKADLIDPSLRLRRAIHTHSLPIVRRLLTTHPHLLQNPDLTPSPPGLSNTSLHLSASLPSLPITQLLLSLGHEAGGISLNTLHQTPLMLAAKNGHAEVVHALLESKDAGGIGKRDTRGRDALMLAAANGFDTCVQLLLTHAPAPSAAELAADPHLTPSRALLRAQDCDGNTALHFASANGQLLVLRTLVAAGAEHERRNAWSWTAVSYSATVAAEVYFKALVGEREEREREGEGLGIKGVGGMKGGLRLVGDE